MKQRISWTQSEDSKLRMLRDQRKIKKWSQIAKCLAQQFNIFGRNGKQCRQRYLNHLKGGINSEDWNENQQFILLQTHKQFGNKWSIIAQKLPGRADNCVKNHFYSRLRKGLRKMNRFSQVLFQSQNLIFKQIILARLIKTADSKFKSQCLSQQLVQYCNDLISKIFRLGLEENTLNESQDEEYLKELILDLESFDKNNKKCFKIKKNNTEGQYKAYLKLPNKNNSISSRSSRSDDCNSIASSCSSYFSCQSQIGDLSYFQDPVNIANQNKTRRHSIAKSTKSSTNYSNKTRSIKYKQQKVSVNLVKIPENSCFSVKSNNFSVSSQNCTENMDMFQISLSPKYYQQQNRFEDDQFNIFLNHKNQINEIQEVDEQCSCQSIFYQDSPYMARILAPTQKDIPYDIWDEDIPIQQQFQINNNNDIQ